MVVASPSIVNKLPTRLEICQIPTKLLEMERPRYIRIGSFALLALTSPALSPDDSSASAVVNVDQMAADVATISLSETSILHPLVPTATQQG